MPHRWIQATGICQSPHIKIESSWHDLNAARPLASTPDSISAAERERIARVHDAYDRVFRDAAVKREIQAPKEEWTPEELELLQENAMRRLAKRRARAAEKAADKAEELGVEIPYTANFVLIST